MERENFPASQPALKMPGFIQNAYESVEKMKDFANLLLDSKLVPDHFYEKGPDNKPDYSKGKTAAVVMVLIQGHQLAMPPLMALQQVVPVNGLLSVKGDGAKSLILNSGKVLQGSWAEKESGSIDDENYAVSITATRIDTNETITRTFSVEKAKRAGLWITKEMLKGNDGWKYQKSAWYKHPERMIKYRALGFLARDLFPDVMMGTYTTEEAQDLPQDTTLIIETGEGGTVKIPDANFSRERSQNITSRATQLIEKKNGPSTVEKHQEEEKKADSGLNAPYTATLDYLKMDSNELMSFVILRNKEMTDALNLIPGRNTVKKLRSIVKAYHEGGSDGLKALCASTQESVSPQQDDRGSQDPVESEPTDDVENFGAEDAADPEFEEESHQEQQMTPNTEFDKDKGPDLGIVIPDLPESGSRDFKAVASLYGGMNELDPPLDDKRYLSIASELLSKYKDKETFCRNASKEDITKVLVANKDNS